jgi:hypothetical protein
MNSALLFTSFLKNFDSKPQVRGFAPIGTLEKWVLG